MIGFGNLPSINHHLEKEGEGGLQGRGAFGPPSPTLPQHTGSQCHTSTHSAGRSYVTRERRAQSR